MNSKEFKAPLKKRIVPEKCTVEEFYAKHGFSPSNELNTNPQFWEEINLRKKQLDVICDKIVSCHK
jgi:hypothetical protein